MTGSLGLLALIKLQLLATLLLAVACNKRRVDNTNYAILAAANENCADYATRGTRKKPQKKSTK